MHFTPQNGPRRSSNIAAFFRSGRLQAEPVLVRKKWRWHPNPRFLQFCKPLRWRRCARPKPTMLSSSGAGAAGGMAAMLLAESGLRVLVLDAGPPSSWWRGSRAPLDGKAGSPAIGARRPAVFASLCYSSCEASGKGTGPMASAGSIALLCLGAGAAVPLLTIWIVHMSPHRIVPSTGSARGCWVGDWSFQVTAGSITASVPMILPRQMD